MRLKLAAIAVLAATLFWIFVNLHEAKAADEPFGHVVRDDITHEIHLTCNETAANIYSIDIWLEGLYKLQEMCGDVIENKECLAEYGTIHFLVFFKEKLKIYMRHLGCSEL